MVAITKVGTNRQERSQTWSAKLREFYNSPCAEIEDEELRMQLLAAWSMGWEAGQDALIQPMGTAQKKESES